MMLMSQCSSVSTGIDNSPSPKSPPRASTTPEPTVPTPFPLYPPPSLPPPHVPTLAQQRQLVRHDMRRVRSERIVHLRLGGTRRREPRLPKHRRIDPPPSLPNPYRRARQPGLLHPLFRRRVDFALHRRLKPL